MKINGIHPLYRAFAGNRDENVMRLIAKVLDPGGYKDQGLVSVGYHPDYPNLAIFNYTEQVTFTKAWDWVTLNSRGLVVDLVAKVVIGLALPKFFNVSEPNAPRVRMEAPFDSRMKMDGSFGICFHYADKWHAATRGSFVSEQAKHATAQLRSQRSTLNTEKMNPKVTYLSEIIYPENRVVVSYADTDALCLLGGFNRETGEEYDLDDLAASVDATWVPPKYSFDNLDAAMTWAKGLPGTMEGIVLRYCDTNERVKIKGDIYTALHRAISQLTPLNVWAAVRDNIEDDMKRALPEEFYAEYDTIAMRFHAQYECLCASIEAHVQSSMHLTNKDIGLRLAEYPELVRRYIFAVRKNPTGWLSDTSLRKKMFDEFRPVANSYRDIG